MMKFSNTLLSTIFASMVFTFLATGCGGAKKALISQTEISQAQQAGTLARLYDKANAALQSKDSDKQEANQLRTQIAQLLVTDGRNKVDQIIAKQKDDPSQVTRRALLNVKQAIAPMAEWSAKDFGEINPKIERAIIYVNQLISNELADAILKEKDIIEQMTALKNAADLGGEGEVEFSDYQAKKTQAISDLIVASTESLAKHFFLAAIKSAKDGLLLDPGNIQLESILSQAEAGQFTKDFSQAIEDGRAEAAYQELVNVVDKPVFLQLKKALHYQILVLANYFSGIAKQAYIRNDYSNAYLHFMRGRKIQQILSVSQKGFMQERRFLDLLMTRAKNTANGDGKRQTLLRVINEFDPNYPGLQAEYLKLSDTVKTRAMTKLAIADFKEVFAADAVVASMGRRIGSMLEKFLFAELGNEVLIVTDINTTENNQYLGLALKIDGEILQAAIERSSNLGKRSQNVQTSVTRIETEEYEDWKDDRRGTAPKQYHETPVFEDVILTVEHVRKLAIGEVAFRIIEPATGKILLTESSVKDSEFSGEAINEYQKGDFHQPYVRDDLPSDIKIVEMLASELANKVGAKLKEFLQNPEQVFYHNYSETKAQKDNIAAMEYLANAVAIAEGKAQDITAWYDELKMMALQ